MKKENEKRVFLTDEQYESLLVKFRVKSKQPERQITTYYSAKDKNSKDIDLRLMRTVDYTKVWMKCGKMHDYRDEFDEFKVVLEYTLKAMDIFDYLYVVKTKFFRERIKIEKQPYIICIDRSINYYAIFEVEISDKKIGEKEAEKLLNTYLQEFGLEETPTEIQNEKYNDYVSKWSKMDFPRDEKHWLSHNEG